MADIIRLGGRLINLDNFSHSVPTHEGQVLYMNNGRLMLSPQETELFMDAVDQKARAVTPVKKNANNQRTALLRPGRRGN